MVDWNVAIYRNLKDLRGRIIERCLAHCLQRAVQVAYCCGVGVEAGGYRSVLRGIARCCAVLCCVALYTIAYRCIALHKTSTAQCDCIPLHTVVLSLADAVQILCLGFALC